MLGNKRFYSEEVEKILNAIEESEAFIFQCTVQLDANLEDLMKATKQAGFFRSTLTKVTMTSA